MNSASYVDEQINILKDKSIPMSEKCWQTALLMVGWAYVYGGWFALCTPSERRKRFGYSPTHTTIKTACKAFDGGTCSGCKWFPDGERTRCGDCRGFTDFVLKQYGFDLYGDTVSTQWNHKDNWCAKGTVADGIPQNVLVNVFIYKNGKWTHTGFYYNGDTVESSSGVQYFSPMKKNRWTHWAVAKCFASEYIHDEKPTDDATVLLPTLKKGDKGDKVKELQKKLLALGYPLPKYGADGSFGNETKAAVEKFQRDWGIPVSGIVDEETWERLLTAPERPVFYTVTITRLLEDQADEIIAKYGGTKTKEG